MGEPEKGNSSNDKDKGKKSQLDEDISDDFLTSWKSMPMAGSDDMDFNFEPVAKGNKKAFDFGKLDMDFSLDGEFGKLSAFKLDMPDLDFSNSPKKSTKSKEKTEESVNGNRPVKKNEFTFSFDFNGLDDFSLDGPPTKGEKNPTREKSSKAVGSMNEIEGGNLSRQVARDNGAPEDTISKRPPPVSDNVPNSKSKDLLNDESRVNVSAENVPSKSEFIVDVIQLKGTQVSSEEILAASAREIDHQNHLSDKAACTSYAQGAVQDFDSVPESRAASVPIPLELTSTYVPSETKMTMGSQGSDKGTQAIEQTTKLSHAVHEAKDLPAMPSLIKTLTQATLSEEMDDTSADETLNSPLSEACTVTGILPTAVVLASDTEKEKPEMLSQLLTEKGSTRDDKCGLSGAVASSAASRHALDALDHSTPSVPDTMSADTQDHSGPPRSTSKYFLAPFKSGSTAAKPTLTAYKVPGGNHSKFVVPRETTSGDRTKVSMPARKRDDSTQLGATNMREENGKKFDDNLSSSTKILVNQDPVFEKTEKNVEPDNSRESFGNGNGKIRSAIDSDAVLQDGRAMKDGLLLRGSEKKINDPKSSSFQVSSVSTGQVTKISNQYHEKFKDKISSIGSLLKSNVSEHNKLSSLKFGKKLGGLPSLKFPVNFTTAKLSASTNTQEKANAKAVGNFDGSARLRTMNKRVPSIGMEKHRPSTPSIKRKFSEAVADGGPVQLQPSKRHSPSDNRIAKEVSSTEFEEKVHTQGMQLKRSRKNAATGLLSPKFDFHQETNMEELGFTLMVENDANIENAEACAKELEDICSMLKQKHEEAKELLVRALVNNNNILMLNHPIYEEKIYAVQRFAARLMSK